MTESVRKWSDSTGFVVQEDGLRAMFRLAKYCQRDFDDQFNCYLDVNYQPMVLLTIVNKDSAGYDVVIKEFSAPVDQNVLLKFDYKEGSHGV